MPLFKAQLFANIDRFGHPDASNPPRIKGVKFDISIEEGAKPVHSKPRQDAHIGAHVFSSASVSHDVKQDDPEE